MDKKVWIAIGAVVVVLIVVLAGLAAAGYFNKSNDPKNGIVYHSNTGKEDQTYISDSNITAPGNTFKNGMYHFVEWNTKSDGKGIGFYEKTDMGEIRSTITDLYAIWHADYIHLSSFSGPQDEKIFIVQDGKEKELDIMFPFVELTASNVTLKITGLKDVKFKEKVSDTELYFTYENGTQSVKLENASDLKQTVNDDVILITFNHSKDINLKISTKR